MKRMPEFAPRNEDAPRLEEGASPHELVLVKAGERFVFPCPPGGEAELLTRLRGLVTDPASRLNWFDAAVVSHAMGQRMSDRLAAQSADPRTDPVPRRRTG